jgi:hypothetical protein
LASLFFSLFNFEDSILTSRIPPNISKRYFIFEKKKIWENFSMFKNNIMFVKPTIRYGIVTTSERILSVFIGQITFSNQACKKSPRAEGVRL